MIGGGVSEAGDLLIGPARDSFSRIAHRPRVPAARPRIGAGRSSAPTAGLVGAADLARPFARRFRRARARARDRRARHPGTP